jgi:hypothetical protein
LVPATAHHMNWTVPTFVPVKGAGTRLYTKLSTLVQALTETKSAVPVLCTRIQDQHGGSDYYNAHPRNEGVERAFRKVFRSLFFTLFAPSATVQRQLLHEMLLAGLRPGQYTAAHLRAYYGNHPIPDDHELQERAVNAVNCASQLRTAKGPSKILFLSDSARAVELAQRHHWPGVVVTPHRDAATAPLLHLDKAVNSTHAVDYTAIFVDLLLLAHAACISHGQGGFGRLGVLLSRDPMCFQKYIDTGRYIECQWKG